MGEYGKYVLFAVVAALIAGYAVYSIIRRNKILKNGVEVDAVVSRIEEETEPSGEGGVDVRYTYYVTYRAPDGQTVEAVLDHAPGRTREGDPVRIKYLPEKPKYAILVK